MIKFTIEIDIEENKNSLEAIRQICGVVREELKNIKGVIKVKPLVKTGIGE